MNKQIHFRKQKAFNEVVVVVTSVNKYKAIICNVYGFVDHTL